MGLFSAITIITQNQLLILSYAQKIPNKLILIVHSKVLFTFHIVQTETSRKFLIMRLKSFSPSRGERIGATRKMT